MRQLPAADLGSQQKLLTTGCCYLFPVLPGTSADNMQCKNISLPYINATTLNDCAYLCMLLGELARDSH